MPLFPTLAFSTGDSALTGSSAGATSSLGGASSLGWMGPAAIYAALIGTGKNIESANPNNPLGQGLLAGLAPSGNQIMKDPIGMGLPTLFGVPFITPFTSSSAAQAAKPEWQSLFSLGSNW